MYSKVSIEGYFYKKFYRIYIGIWYEFHIWKIPPIYTSKLHFSVILRYLIIPYFLCCEGEPMRYELQQFGSSGSVTFVVTPPGPRAPPQTTVHSGAQPVHRRPRIGATRVAIVFHSLLAHLRRRRRYLLNVQRRLGEAAKFNYDRQVGTSQYWNAMCAEYSSSTTLKKASAFL